MIGHKDVNRKALAFLLISILAAFAIAAAWSLPPREATRSPETFNLLGAAGGRVYSMLPDAGNRVIGFTYLAPRKHDFRATSRVGIEAARDEGFLRGYSLPPNRLAFTSDGRAFWLPSTPSPAGPTAPRVVDSGNRGARRIALTFDTSDVAESARAQAIFDALGTLKVPATFFVCGGWCNANPQFLRELVDRGLEIGNHSDSHPNFTQIPAEQMVQEIRNTEAAVQKIGGVRITAYFRPPYGAWNDAVVTVAGQLGYATVLWNVDTLDWSDATTQEQLVENAVGQAQNGDIVIMHTHGRYTASALPDIVAQLRASGFELTTVSGVLQP